MLRANVRAEIPDNINLAEIENWVDDNCETIAHEVAADAGNSAAFVDQSGALRDSIVARKSKFKDGGWIVLSDVPHAHLVEFGHAKVLWGRQTNEKVPPHPFLRPALDRAIGRAVALFRGAGA